MPQVSAAMDKAKVISLAGIQYASSSVLPLLCGRIHCLVAGKKTPERDGLIARQPDDKAKSCFDYAGCRSFVLVGAYTMGGNAARRAMEERQNRKTENDFKTQ